jgi:hypothetical protein
VFYIQSGKVKLTVVSKRGKEAVVATCRKPASLARAVWRANRFACPPPARSTEYHPAGGEVGHVRSAPSGTGICRTLSRYLLSRNIRMEADLVDNLFRLLLLLTNFGQESKPIPVIAKMSQESFAEMIDTTRSRVSFSF